MTVTDTPDRRRASAAQPPVLDDTADVEPAEFDGGIPALATSAGIPPDLESAVPSGNGRHTSPSSDGSTDADQSWPEQLDAGDQWKAETDFADPTESGPDQPPAEPPTTQALVDAVEMLRTALEASQQAQEHQRALLSKLHEERQILREAEQRRLRDPVFRDLIQLSDTCVRNSRQWKDRGDVTPETAEKVSSVLLEAADDVRLTLERQGVERFAPLANEKFDRTEAKAVGSRPTTDSTKDGLVAEVRKSGYRLEDRVLRYSEVVVWRVQPEAESKQ